MRASKKIPPIELSQKVMEDYFDRLWPICRSILGEGYRNSLDILSEIMPVDRIKFKSGYQAYDWTVPMEWFIREAYFVGPDGKKYCDFKKNNLHVLNYSAACKRDVDLIELKKHLYTLRGLPNAIPYQTSYYEKKWGFCISYNEYKRLKKGLYKVNIDSGHKSGELVVGESVLPGKSKKEILLSSYLCHPSMANNELSGPLVTAFLYHAIKQWSNRYYTYRFVICPETIGAICYLHKKGEHLKKQVQAGYQITCIGDRAPFTYKRSRRGDSLADRAAECVLKEYKNSSLRDFTPHGSDERQYGSPGFNLPIGSLIRSVYGEYKEYHTSLDNKKFICFKSLQESVRVLVNIVNSIEENTYVKSTVLHGEPQLSKHGLFIKDLSKRRALKWLLNLGDGSMDLLSISAISKVPINLLIELKKECLKSGIMKESRNAFKKK